MTDEGNKQAEEVVRALASAAAALRLYPPTSEIPAAAIARFVRVADAFSREPGSVRYVVEPKTIRYGDAVFGRHNQQIASLAEELYGHQVGQLIVMHGISAEETSTFLRCAGSDPSAVREEGGLRTVTVGAGVEHIAVIELTLRASSEEGLLGLDLTSAPLDIIGHEVVRAAADWARTGTEGPGSDTVAEAIDRLEPAARDLAAHRMGDALRQLDESTRAAVLAAALRRDATGAVMDGLLEVVAHMQPATLARLLVLAAGRMGQSAMSLLPSFDLPPEAARALALMLRTSPRSDAEMGIPASVDPKAMADEVAEESEAEEVGLAATIAAASPADAAARALKTTLTIAGAEPEAEALEAIGDAIGPALSAGAFRLVKAALAVVDSASVRPGLEVVANRVRQSVSHGDSVLSGLKTVRDPARATDVAAVISRSGVPGSDALLTAWLEAEPPQRAALEAVMRLLPEPAILAASRRLRSEGAQASRDMIALLGSLGDRRALPALAQALDHPSPEVRFAAVSTLAAYGSDEGWLGVASALRNPDEATASRALAEICAAKPPKAVPALIAALEARRPLNRSSQFRLELIQCLREMRATSAISALKREAGHLFAMGAGRRAVRAAAREALIEIKKSVK